MTFRELIHNLDKAYEDDGLLIGALNGDKVGDTLAEFIVREAADVSGSTECCFLDDELSQEQFLEIERAMTRAMDQLQRIVDATRRHSNQG